MNSLSRIQQSLNEFESDAKAVGFDVSTVLNKSLTCLNTQIKENMTVSPVKNIPYIKIKSNFSLLERDRKRNLFKNLLRKFIRCFTKVLIDAKKELPWLDTRSILKPILESDWDNITVLSSLNLGDTLCY